MKKVFPDLPEWSFDMDEVSAGVYEVVGKDAAGHCVSAKGIDLDALVEDCRHDAIKISETFNYKDRGEKLGSEKN